MARKKTRLGQARLIYPILPRRAHCIFYIIVHFAGGAAEFSTIPIEQRVLRDNPNPCMPCEGLLQGRVRSRGVASSGYWSGLVDVFTGVVLCTASFEISRLRKQVWKQNVSEICKVVTRQPSINIGRVEIVRISILHVCARFHNCPRVCNG